MAELSHYFPEMIKTRRYFHRSPEVAWAKFLTTQTIIQRVHELSIKTVVGKALFDVKHAFDHDEKQIQATFLEALKQGWDLQIAREIEGFTGCLTIWKTFRPPILI